MMRSPVLSRLEVPLEHSILIPIAVTMTMSAYRSLSLYEYGNPVLSWSSPGSKNSWFTRHNTVTAERVLSQQIEMNQLVLFRTRQGSISTLSPPNCITRGDRQGFSRDVSLNGVSSYFRCHGYSRRDPPRSGVRSRRNRNLPIGQTLGTCFDEDGQKIAPKDFLRMQLR